MASGFKAFCILNIMKNFHFNSAKFDMMNLDLDHLNKYTFYPKLVKSWNDKIDRKMKDSFIYGKIESKYPVTKDLRTLFAVYVSCQPKWSVFNIFQDNLVKYDQYISESHWIEHFVLMHWSELLISCREKMMCKKAVFSLEKRIPQIYIAHRTGKISTLMLLILDKIFDIRNKMKLDTLDKISKERFLETKHILDKFEPLVYNDLTSKNIDYAKIKTKMKEIYDEFC